ncbi:MAG: DUF262 domain-containing protein [Paracraurococcus sp.]
MSGGTGVVQDLTVKGEAIERVFGSYISDRYIVNRRYQRKLIWTSEEKVNFIDSLLRGYPVPIILLAENRTRESNMIEIIDGMQRMNAVMSFIENDYGLQEGYFDLESMAVTKELLDAGKLAQRSPRLSRDKSVKIASYQLPFSIFEFSDESSVDEVFRRINSGGRKLSRQELRSAGSLGHFAQVVRRIAAKLRGDDSRSDILPLSGMKKISISNRDVEHGINVDEIFWVKNGMLTKEQVRESRDEELVADVLAYMVSETPLSSRSEVIDSFFGMRDDEASRQRYQEIELAVQQRGQELLITDFQRTIDEFIFTLDQAGETFGRLLFGQEVARAPRYFQVVFLALYKLVVRSQKTVANRNLLVGRLRDGAKNIEVPEGGRWGAEQRSRAIDAAVGLFDPAFAPADAVDPALVHWITQLRNLLSQSYTEQAAYDFKQGFLCLDGSNKFDDGSFEKILRTCVGIANIRKLQKGYVLVGIADDFATAQRIEGLFKSSAKRYESFYITGTDHEATALGKNQDQLFQMIIDKVRRSKISEPLKDFMLRHIKPIRYYDKTVYVFEVIGQENVSDYGGEYYLRHGAQLSKVEGSDLGQLFRRYLLGN